MAALINNIIAGRLVTRGYGIILQRLLISGYNFKVNGKTIDAISGAIVDTV